MSSVSDRYLHQYHYILSIGFFPLSTQGLLTPFSKVKLNTILIITEASVWTVNCGTFSGSIINSRLNDVLTSWVTVKWPKSVYQWLYLHWTPNKHNIYTVYIQKALDSIWHKGRFYIILESCVGCKTCFIKFMFTNKSKCTMCVIIIGNKRSKVFPQERGVRRSCCLILTLIYEWASVLDQLAAHQPKQQLRDELVHWFPTMAQNTANIHQIRSPPQTVPQELSLFNSAMPWAEQREESHHRSWTSAH